MRVRLLTNRASETMTWHVGDEIDVPDREGHRMVAEGQAEFVEPETAAIGPQRAAVLERPRLNKRGR